MRIGIIGCGSLGTALAQGLGRDEGLSLSLHDRHPERVEAAAAGALAKVARAQTASAAADGVSVLVLAVKPYAIVPLLREVSGFTALNTLVVSVAAGVPLSALEEVSDGRPLARAMPNTASGLGAGTTACILGSNTLEDRDQLRLEQTFSAVGRVRFCGSEQDLHAVTALSASGPAFLLLAYEAMIDAGVGAGLRRAESSFYALGALRAAAALADTGEEPAVLRGRIASPGGTTVAGLLAEERAGVRAGLQAAVEAAVRRSREMSGE